MNCPDCDIPTFAVADGNDGELCPDCEVYWTPERLERRLQDSNEQRMAEDQFRSLSIEEQMSPAYAGF